MSTTSFTTDTQDVIQKITNMSQENEKLKSQLQRKEMLLARLEQDNLMLSELLSHMNHA